MNPRKLSGRVSKALLSQLRWSGWSRCIEHCSTGSGRSRSEDQGEGQGCQGEGCQGQSEVKVKAAKMNVWFSRKFAPQPSAGSSFPQSPCWGEQQYIKEHHKTKLASTSRFQISDFRFDFDIQVDHLLQKSQLCLLQPQYWPGIIYLPHCASHPKMY